jgi:hypothetical protein
MGFLIWLFIILDRKIKNKEDADFKTYNKMYYVFLGLVLAPMVMELPDKFAILFYDVDEAYMKAEVYNVEVKGYFKTGTSKNGGRLGLMFKMLMIKKEGM